MQKSEEHVLEIAKAERELSENVGLATVVFRPTDKLTMLAEGIYRHSTPKCSEPPQADANDLTAWKDETVRQLQRVVDDCVASPLRAFVEHLKSELS